MKYSIHGFSQPKAVELGLGSDDLLVLRWFVDFAGTSRMRTVLDDGRVFYWIDYGTVLKDLPILNISKKTLYRKHFTGLCDAGVLEHKHLKEGGSYSYYCYGINYEKLVYLQEDTPLDKIDTPRSELSHPLGQNCPNKDNNIINNKENSSTKSKRDSTVLTDDATITLLNSSFTSQKVITAFKEFLSMRKAKGSKHRVSTEYCLRLLINRLREFATTEDAALAVLNYSIERNYDGLFNPNDRKCNDNPNQSLKQRLGFVEEVNDGVT